MRLNKTAVILIFPLAVLMTVSGCLKKQPPEENVERNNHKTVATSIVKINEDGWKTLYNYKYKFKIRFPKELKVIGDENTTITNVNYKEKPYLEDGDIRIDVYTYTQNQDTDLISWFNDNAKSESGYVEKLGNKIVEIRKINLLGMEAVQQIIKFDNPAEGSPGMFNQIYFKSDNLIYLIMGNIPFENAEQLKLFKSIINTFELLK